MTQRVSSGVRRAARLSMRRATLGALIGALTVAVALPGCKTQPKAQRRVERATPVAENPPPLYTDLVAIHNSRVETLDPLWAAVSVQVRGTNAEGGSYVEQGEGSLQVQRPRNIALSIGKVGEVYYILGSNESSYWWLDLIEDEQRGAVVGEHALATADKAGELGVPVLPLDLIELFNLAPWPTTYEVEPPVFWSQDSALVGVELPTAGGFRRVWLEPEGYRPRMVQLFTDDGIERLRCVPKRNVIVENTLDPSRSSSIAERYEILLVDTLTTVNIEISSAKVRQLNSAVFNLEELLTRKGIGPERVVSLDDASPIRLGRTSGQGVIAPVGPAVR